MPTMAAHGSPFNRSYELGRPWLDLDGPQVGAQELATHGWPWMASWQRPKIWLGMADSGWPCGKAAQPGRT